MHADSIVAFENVGLSEAYLSCPDGVVVVERDGTIYTVNSAITRLLGYAKGEIVGKPLEVLIPERIRDRHGQFFQEWLRHPTPRSMGPQAAVTALHADGTEIPVLISLSYVETRKGIVPVAWLRAKDLQ